MKRIVVVGSSGSGKSTLANNLGKKLNLPVFHLDKYYWDVGWKERYATKEEFNNVARGFAEQDKWIIDGNYRGTMDMRFERADTIIFLDFPKWRCIFRVLKRTLNRKQPFDKTKGVKDKVDWFLIKWIVNYPTDTIREKILAYAGQKAIYVLKNDKEINDLILFEVS